MVCYCYHCCACLNSILGSLYSFSRQVVTLTYLSQTPLLRWRSSPTTPRVPRTHDFTT